MNQLWKDGAILLVSASAIYLTAFAIVERFI